MLISTINGSHGGECAKFRSDPIRERDREGELPFFSSFRMFLALGAREFTSCREGCFSANRARENSPRWFFHRLSFRSG